MGISFGSVCSGIESASMAWGGIGFVPWWFSEIEPFPCSVLEERFPEVWNLGDMTKLRGRFESGELGAPQVLIGGTPCQAFSVAGMRKGLEDSRGQLTLEFVRILEEVDHVRTRNGEPPAILVWENVPGVLSSKDNAFGCFLGALAGEDAPLDPPGGRWSNAGFVLGPSRAIAWRVLDAQYFGVAQRRRRVFLVASSGDGPDPREILFEFDGVRRDSPPRREAGKDFAHDVAPCLTSGGRGVERAGETRGQDPVVANTLTVGADQTWGRPCGEPIAIAKSFDSRNGLAAHGSTELRDVANPLRATDYKDPQIAVCATGSIFHTLCAEGYNASEDGTGRSVGAVAVAFSSKDYGADAAEGLAPTMRSMGHSESHANGGGQLAVAIRDVAPTLTRNYGKQPDSSDTNSGPRVLPTRGMRVRRLTPTECERLQGFPDGHTRIPWRGKGPEECPDGPRYKACGNSKAVPVVRWLGKRLAKAISEAYT